MVAYIFRRLGILSVILFGSSFILYNLAAISGDPLEALRTSTDPNAKQQILALTRTLQLDVPPPLRYFLWLKGILAGFTGHIDFGKTRDAQLVTSVISTAIPTTIRLVFLATITAIVLDHMRDNIFQDGQWFHTHQFQLESIHDSFRLPTAHPRVQVHLP